MTPSAPTDGSPEDAPWPAELATPPSTVPAGVFVPVAVEPPAAPPVAPPSKPPSRSRSWRGKMPILKATVRLCLAGAAVPMNVDTAEAALTGPPPLVLPRGGPLLRMTAVSACAPHLALLHLSKRVKNVSSIWKVPLYRTLDNHVGFHR